MRKSHVGHTSLPHRTPRAPRAAGHWSAKDIAIIREEESLATPDHSIAAWETESWRTRVPGSSSNFMVWTFFITPSP